MHALEGWTRVPSLAHEQSVDSGFETDAFSLISANPEISETSCLDLDAIWNMDLPLSNDRPNPSPVKPTVIDWVQTQYQHDQTSNHATMPQCALVDGTPPGAGQVKQGRTNTNDHASLQEGCQPAKKVYDIATLLKLKEIQSTVPVMLRVKPEAIAENIFQYMGAATSRRLATPSRGLSDISNTSTGIAEPHGHTVYSAARPKYMTQPLRQPHAPPETSILQRHDGFARFLKQHASPPHHRVTAGGRIVPAGPSSPPPMLDFGSLNGLLRDHPATAKSSQKESRSTQSNPRAQNPQATPPMTLGDYLQFHGSSVDGTSRQHESQPPPMQTAFPYNNLPFGYQSFMAPSMQTQVPMVPMAMFPDGSTLFSYNGIHYRASWNGMNTTLEPLQPLQQPIDLQFCPQPFQQGQFNSSYPSVVPQPSEASLPSIPLATATNVARPDISKVDEHPQHSAQNSNELSLKTELSNLDKHLALYHYDIMPAERATMIARRRCLVEKIDRIRLSKEKPKHSIPIIAPASTGMPITPAAQPAPGSNRLHEAVQNGRVVKGGTVNKHLSPAAPAFVPRKTSNLPSTSFDMRTASQQANHQQFGIQVSSGVIDLAPMTQNHVDASTWAGHPAQKILSPKTQKTSHNEASSSSSVLDPSDPAMRVIDYEDIEYAGRYLYNWRKNRKAYCTTVAEFQEAVRRVREQARLYGCAGGQSKDPAYDAEQDLWWAICDRDPIPLPSEVPDHVFNPRPWNWNDSAFNYRHQGADDAPVPGCELARHSPRVIGWDPATTEKMKDVMDVSRSYFALKGRLPSVPFRDLAYDRDGNKRLIQSGTEAFTAYDATREQAAPPGPPPMATSQREGFVPSSDSSALKEVSKSELNIQPASSAASPQTKSIPEEQASNADSLSKAPPRTPEHRRIRQSLEASSVYSTLQTPKPHRSASRGITKSKNTEAALRLCQAYVEDYSETPAAAEFRAATKNVLSRQVNITPSKIQTSPLPSGNIDVSTGSPVPAYVSISTILSGSSQKPTKEELDSIWYHTPLDEVTQKYLDDMKAYNPFKNKHIDVKNHKVEAATYHRQSSDSSEPVTESKSPWGPEENTVPTTPGGRDHLESIETYARTEKRGMAKTAKVNIPSVSTIRAPIPHMNGNDPCFPGFNVHNTLDPRDFDAVNVPSVEGNDSHHFLRKMLKSPRYSSAQPMSLLNQISTTLADKISGSEWVQANSTERQAKNKGNTAPNKHGDTGTIGSKSYANERPPNSASLARAGPNLTVSKAHSSLASSNYQAHGYLPQFSGAGKAHTSSVYREQGIQPIPQVRLPSEASYGDRKQAAEASSHRVYGPSAYTPSTTYHSPVNFGYDGGRDSPPPKTTSAPQNRQPTRPVFDSMGVSQADYENQREDANNAWHHGTVEDFFQDLHEQELKTIASHKRVNTQSA